MMSHCGRYVIAFNGEVYNFAALRDELQQAGVAPAWHGHSDTEVMLAAIAAWGLESALKKFVGMSDDLGKFRQNAFFAIFDRLVAEGSGGRAPRNSSLILEITAIGKQKVTKVLTAIRAAPEM